MNYDLQWMRQELKKLNEENVCLGEDADIIYSKLHPKKLKLPKGWKISNDMIYNCKSGSCKIILHSKKNRLAKISLTVVIVKR